MKDVLMLHHRIRRNFTGIWVVICLSYELIHVRNSHGNGKRRERALDIASYIPESRPMISILQHLTDDVGQNRVPFPPPPQNWAIIVISPLPLSQSGALK